jgi:cell division protein FtsQ
LIVDPRIERRRRTVRENTLHRRLRTILWLCVLGATVGAVVWVLQSPLLEVRTIGIYGVDRSSVVGILKDAGVEVGAPMVRVNTGRLEALLEEDPWVAAVHVERTFPHTVEVDVSERSVAAGVAYRGGWTLLSTDGIVLGPAGSLPVGAARLVMGNADPGPAGEPPQNEMIAGGLEFAVALPPTHRGEVSIGLRAGELWAGIGSVSVRLGSPLEMTAKAKALEALLEAGVPDGAVINLIAPSRPAVQGSS